MPTLTLTNDDDLLDEAARPIDGDPLVIFALDGDDTIFGHAGVDVIFAGPGNDILDGLTGSNSIDAGTGNDLITAGPDPESLDGGAGTDTLSYRDAADSVSIDLVNGSVTEGDGDIDIVRNFEVFQASNNNDSIIGEFDVAEVIYGLEGSDTIAAGPGDIVYGGGSVPAGVDPNDQDVLSIQTPPGGSFVANADPANLENGTIDIFSGANGTGDLVGTVTYFEIEPICFTAGTMIATPSGEVAIENVGAGDLVLTRDRGAQPVRWLGRRKFSAEGRMAPVIIKAGAVGNDRDLMVSQLHRMLITDWRAELMFGEAEVLASAKHLVNGDTIYIAEGGEVEYVHLLFDQHEIVTANGAASESFHPGEQGLSSLEEGMREEIFTIFPELRVQMDGYGPAARMLLKAYEARALGFTGARPHTAQGPSVAGRQSYQRHH